MAKLEVFDIANELIIIPKAVIDEFLKHQNPAELIALYSFYYYTAKWQKTNQPKCSTNYVAKGIHWKPDKVRKVKHQLVDIGLVKDVKDIDKQTHKIKGWYIKVNYIFKRNKVNKIIENHPPPIPEGGKSQSVETGTTNALSSNSLNALNTNNNADKKSAISNDIYKEIENKYFDLFINKFGNKPDYKYNRDRGILSNYITKYGKQHILNALDIYFQNGIGDFFGYTITGLQSSYNKILVKMKKTPPKEITGKQAVREVAEEMGYDYDEVFKKEK